MWEGKDLWYSCRLEDNNVIIVKKQDVWTRFGMNMAKSYANSKKARSHIKTQNSFKNQLNIGHKFLKQKIT
jgi:hypothetical protein